MDLEKSFEYLKHSPIFAISLSSKELFHSNFWAWLIEYNPEFSRVFFDDIDVKNNLIVKREEKNRDLSIHVKDKVYIIENKLKSLPREEQIKIYQEKEKYFCKGCLTGFIRLNSLPYGWHFKSYKEIGEAILRINEKYKDNDWYIFIQEYAKMIIEIEKIMVEFGKKHGDRLITNSQYDLYLYLREFEDIRFADILKKMKANEFANYLNKNLTDELKKSLGDSDFKLYIGSDFSNKSSIVDVRIIKNKDDDNEVMIGIQIQDNQYRFCAERKRGTLNFSNDNILNEFFGEFLDFGWFEKYDKSSKTLMNKKTGMTKDFCKYCTNNYKFIYQYYTLDEDGLKFENLLKDIRKDMLSAIEISKKLTNSNDLKK